MSGMLEGKTVLITGAGRGLGRGIARGIAQAQGNLCITDINEATLRQATVEMRTISDNILSSIADVRVLEDLKPAIAKVIERWGRLDVVINNAAIMPLIPFDNTSPDLWEQIIGVNLTGVYNGVRASWEQMKQQGGGHYVSIGSAASVYGFENEVAYCASKHALEGFTKALAIEAEPYNIAVNTMGPGKPIKPTSMTRAEAMAQPAERRAGWVDPVELAPGFIWLISQPPARFTGLRFDAGPIADEVAANGYDFEFAPQKVTHYVSDFTRRLEQRRKWTRLATD